MNIGYHSSDLPVLRPYGARTGRFAAYRIQLLRNWSPNSYSGFGLAGIERGAICTHIVKSKCTKNVSHMGRKLGPVQLKTQSKTGTL